MAKDNTLFVSGRVANEGQRAEILYRGIAGRAFERRFVLADHMVVEGADVENGLLHVGLKRVVPEALKPRKISIGSGNASGGGVSTPTDADCLTIPAGRRQGHLTPALKVMPKRLGSGKSRGPGDRSPVCWFCLIAGFRPICVTVAPTRRSSCTAVGLEPTTSRVPPPVITLYGRLKKASAALRWLPFRPISASTLAISAFSSPM